VTTVDQGLLVPTNETSHPSARVVVRLTGELDVATLPSFHAAMAELRRRAPKAVVLDAKDLTFVGLRGMHALTAEAAALRRSGCSLETRNLRPNVERLVRLLHAGAQLSVVQGVSSVASHDG
jgi:anti-anti-sigma factor